MSRAVSQLFGSTTFGICFCHRSPISVSGMLVTNTIGSLMNVEGLPAGTQFSVARARCGHVGMVMTASPTVKHGVGIARQFDTGVGCYNFTILTGASSTKTP